MKNIVINDCVWKTHPVYNLYAANENGEIIHIVKQVPTKGACNGRGYLNCTVRKYGQNGQKNCRVHRFV